MCFLQTCKLRKVNAIIRRCLTSSDGAASFYFVFSFETERQVTVPGAVTNHRAGLSQPTPVIPSRVFGQRRGGHCIGRHSPLVPPRSNPCAGVLDPVVQFPFFLFFSCLLSCRASFEAQNYARFNAARRADVGDFAWRATCRLCF